jgi:putative RecB family exonuclease
MIGAVQSTFSPSSLSTFEKCPKQYHYRYVARIPVETESIEAFLGKRVHEILERLYRFVDKGQVPSLERVLWRYRRNWEERYDAARIRIVRSEMAPGDYRATGAQCVENYYRSHYPFDADETLGLERPVRFALDANGAYAMRGIIDRVVRARDGVLEIHDFKTGRRIPAQEDLDRDRQLALYELGLRAELPGEGSVRLVWHYVLRRQVRTSMRTPEQLETLRQETAALIDRIRGERAWEPRPSPLCGWCEYRALCPAVSGPEPCAEPPGLEDAALEDQLRLL